MTLELNPVKKQSHCNLQNHSQPVKQMQCKQKSALPNGAEMCQMQITYLSIRVQKFLGITNLPAILQLVHKI